MFSYANRNVIAVISMLRKLIIKHALSYLIPMLFMMIFLTELYCFNFITDALRNQFIFCAPLAGAQLITAENVKNRIWSPSNFL